ncbi:MAG: type II toxin-antitoxin system VapB family antitoxin [Actinobacteria bacterium]|nr:type II toxin-antitoxin system VapB family antitoxin [Actinomycetota bacterium]MBU1943018.1 type II toxin-antitoxin system VapB family antitoxin [Actinomycetota bacterium]MBU2686900.1 type II toxin-antitoxin system VapB family antitoxin [Actinomycetota bacterium]
MLEEAKRVTGVKTTKDVVHLGLESLMRKERLKQIASHRGSGLRRLTHEDLEEMRLDD